MSNRAIHILVAAGLVNIIGVLIFSQGFTNPYLAIPSPVIFSNFGFLLIILWGLAYIAASRAVNAHEIVGVFAIEKLVYGLSWAIWMSEPSIPLQAITSQSVLTGLFYILYGPIDIVFGGLFVAIAFKKL